MEFSLGVLGALAVQIMRSFALPEKILTLWPEFKA